MYHRCITDFSPSSICTRSTFFLEPCYLACSPPARPVGWLGGSSLDGITDTPGDPTVPTVQLQLPIGDSWSCSQRSQQPAASSVKTGEMKPLASSLGLVLATLPPPVDGHGYLATPRGRNIAAFQDGVDNVDNDAFKTPSTPRRDWCSHCVNRGGVCGAGWERNVTGRMITIARLASSEIRCRFRSKRCTTRAKRSLSSITSRLTIRVMSR
mmetsp:Transcript_13691/g.31231  ORF Transcript_13691/g.31231 Transcript_13691/m.31231 type:complete len:211 (+) Transcript_13691:78-710(+)